MTAQGRLDGQVAVVTGGTQGIGQGVVLRFLKEGASVVYCSRNPANNEENEGLIADIPGAAGRALFVQADVGDKTQMTALVETAVERFGRVDIVVNNAQGIAPLKAIEEKPDEDYAMTLATGFYHSLWTGQAAFPHMKAQRSGRIINFSSHWNMWGQVFSSDYNITKAANEGLTRSMAHEWGQYGITVNCIVPAGDSFAYKQYKKANPEVGKTIERTIPARRMGDCEVDIAGAILGLCSANGRYITGQVFCVDGATWAAIPLHEHEAGTDIHEGRHQSAVA